jgi:hypothetical protein
MVSRKEVSNTLCVLLQMAIIMRKTLTCNSYIILVFKFIIKKVLGRFIDEPDLSQLDVQLSKGQYNLSNVSLNIKRINEHLRDLPFVLKSGYIEQIKIRIPFNILNENMHIEVNGIELSFKSKGMIFPCFYNSILSCHTNLCTNIHRINE